MDQRQSISLSIKLNKAHMDVQPVEGNVTVLLNHRTDNSSVILLPSTPGIGGCADQKACGQVIVQLHNDLAIGNCKRQPQECMTVRS